MPVARADSKLGVERAGARPRDPEGPLSALTVRLYQPGDEPGIARLFRLAFDKEMSLDHWRWKYQGQGGQRTYAAVAIDPVEGMVAHYGGVPLRMIHDGRPIRGLAIGDVMVHPRFRGLLVKNGLFNRVAELVPAAAVADGFVFGFGFPSERALRLPEKLGLYERIEEVIQARRPTRPGGGRWRYAYRLRPLDWDDPRIDRLWERMAGRIGLGVIRDRAYLAWRYRDHPLHRYQLLGLQYRWRGRLEGLAVVREMDDSLYVMDLVFGASPRALIERLDHVAATLPRPALTLWLPPPWHQRLARWGFALASAGIVIPRTTHPGTLTREQVQGRFYYTLGDFDVN